MALRVGIGLVTFNRREILAGTIAHVRAHTRRAPMEFIVADDGSTDGTQQMCRELGICRVSGINRGVAWNKNRALFMLSRVLNCDVIILLEDDARPVASAWEDEWIAAALRWGHAGYAGSWMRDRFLSGTGTAADPVLAPAVTAQCAVYARWALSRAGYFDSRFKGFGHEHVEHTLRLMRHGFGGVFRPEDAGNPIVFYPIEGAVAAVDSATYFDFERAEQNRILMERFLVDTDYRDPWRGPEEEAALRNEISAALRIMPPSTLNPVVQIRAGSAGDSAGSAMGA